MIQIGDIISRLNLESTGLVRSSIDPKEWTMATMLASIERVGKSFCPHFVIDSDNEEVYTNLAYWIMNDGRMTAINPLTGQKIPGRLDKGIYLAGNTGSGKTVAMQILRRLYTINPFVQSQGNKLRWHESRADEISDTFANKGDLAAIKSAPLLCIQDLGSEPIETVFMGNRSKIMQSVMEYRGDASEQVTMVTSNIPLGHEDLAVRYGERATSRMIDMMNYLTLTGKDRRLKI